MEYSVDLISDLNLGKTEQFDWVGKPTSLFCIVAGNISRHLAKIDDVLGHLGTIYRGVLYIDGSLEHYSIRSYDNRVEEITDICGKLPNVVYMHNHVVVLNDIAFVAANGWYGNTPQPRDEIEELMYRTRNNEDIAYLSTTLKGLQSKRDSKKIVVVSNSIPYEYLNYNYNRVFDPEGIEPGLTLALDRGNKVTHWLYGGTTIESDINYNGRRFVNNPRVAGQPYWPKRIMI